MLGEVLFAHQEMQAVIKVIADLADSVSKTRWDWQPAPENTELAEALSDRIGDNLDVAYRTIDKQDRVTQLDALRTDAMELVSEVDGISEEDIRDGFKKLEKKIVRGRITRGEP